MKKLINRLPSWATWIIVSMLCVSVLSVPQGMSSPAGADGDPLALFGAQTASAADYSVATQQELTDAIAAASDGSVITVTHDIDITTSAIWANKTLTIKGAYEGILLMRIAGSENAPMFIPGGTGAGVTAAAGLILKDIIIDDDSDPDGFGYDGIVAAYGPNVTITLDSGAVLKNSGGKSGVYLGNAVGMGAGPRLDMREGSSILYGESSGGSSGAGVYAGLGSVFEMDGGIIQSNRTTGSGGGVYVDNSATFIMRGTALVKGNSAEAGGGVLVSANGEGGAFIMEGGTVTGNVLTNSNTTKNKHGIDIAVEAPRGSSPVKAGTAPNYTDAAFVAQVYQGAVIGNGRIGVQNEVSTSYAPSGMAFNQAIYVPTPINGAYFAGSLRQFGAAADTAVLDSLNAAAVAAMTPSYPTYAGLTYAGELQVSADSQGRDATVSLNFPDEIPAYDGAGNNIRDRYGYSVAYVPLTANGAILTGETPTLAVPARGVERITFDIPNVPGASSYGIVKYYYEKSGDMNLSLMSVGGGSLREKNSGSTSLHFDSLPSGSGFVPVPPSYTLKATADAGWKLGSVILTAGDGLVMHKDANVAGEVTVDYYDLAYGVNKITATFVRDSGAISINVTGFESVYDGKAHCVTVSGTLPTDAIAYSYRVGDSGFIKTSSNPSFTDVNSVIAKNINGGKGDEIIVYVTATRGGISVRDSAFVKITPRAITVKPVDRKRKYNGESLVAKAVELVSGSLVSGHRINASQAKYTGSRIDIGTSKSRVSGVTVAGTDPANYAVSHATGKLVITKPDPVPEDKDKSGSKNGGAGNSGGTGSSSGNSGNAGEGTGTTGGGTDNNGNSDTGSGTDNGGETGNGDNPVVDNPDDNGDDGGDDGAGDDTTIEPIPPPTSGGGTGGDGHDSNGNIFALWWVWLIIALAVAAVVIWLLLASKRRRRDADEY